MSMKQRRGPGVDAWQQPSCLLAAGTEGRAAPARVTW